MAALRSAARLFTSQTRSMSAAAGPSATAGGHGGSFVSSFSVVLVPLVGVGGARLWKILSFTVAIPGVLLCYINAQLKEAEHHEHHHRPEFVPYEHLRLRSKKFPWGDGNKSLFHNKEANALPEGYEEEE